METVTDKALESLFTGTMVLRHEGMPQVPPDAGRDSRRPKHDAEHAGAAYQSWQDSLLADRRKHRDNAWYLPLRIPSPPSTTTRDGLR